MTSDCGISSHFVDSHLIGDVKSCRMGNVKLDPSATIVVAGHSTFSGVSMGTLTVCVTDAQGLIADMLLPAMNVPRLGRHQFWGGAAALKGVNISITKQSYLDDGRLNKPLRYDTDCPTIIYLDLELAPRDSHQMKAACYRRGLSRGTHYRRSRLWPSAFSGAGPWKAVAPPAIAAQPFIVTSTACQVSRLYGLQLRLSARA